MASEQTHEKEQLHELVERLAPGQVHAVRDLLQVMLDPSRAPSPTRLWMTSRSRRKMRTLLRRPASAQAERADPA